MQYPFRVCGTRIEIYRYKIEYKEQESAEIFYTTNKEEADMFISSFGGAVFELDTKSVDWLDGLEVLNTPDTFGEAVKIYNDGKELYEKKESENRKSRNQQLRADIDFIAVMSGVQL